jgi:prolyl oligopeptidase PreP (S9A serine peptidase family)
MDLPLIEHLKQHTPTGIKNKPKEHIEMSSLNRQTGRRAFLAALGIGMSSVTVPGTDKSKMKMVRIAQFDAAEHRTGVEEVDKTVKDGTRYPAVLLTTGFNDPHVDSWEPGKMAARLQAATSSGKPVQLRVDFRGGHGIGSAADQQREVAADSMSFMLWQSGASGFQPNR